MQYLWAASLALQVFVGVLILVRRHYRKLPFFTAYIFLNIAQAAVLYFIYRFYGYTSHMAYVSAWWSEAITLVARVAATIEVLRAILTPYRGIWGLAWRLLAGSSLVVLVMVSVAFALQRSPDWILNDSDRGFHLIFAVALVSCLLLIRYYQVAVATPFKILLITFCFYSCVKVFVNTVLEAVLYQRYLQFGAIWQIASLSSFALILLMWAAVLVRPLPARIILNTALPAEVYGSVVPAIHRQLYALNQQLMDFWKIKGQNN